MNIMDILKKILFLAAAAAIFIYGVRFSGGAAAKAGL